MTRLTANLLAALAILVAAAANSAQAFPTEPVKLIVGYPPGGSTDIASRIIAEKLTQDTGANFIVDNRPGAGGMVAAGSVARATPDGHTLLFAASPEVALARALGRKMDYDVKTDLKPVTTMGHVPFMLVVNPDVPAANLKEFLEHARRNPGKLNYASFGIGTSNHLFGEYFKSRTGLDIVHIPYKGSSPAIADLLGGRVQMAFDTIPAVLPHIQRGKLRPLAVAMNERFPLAPDVPTMAEAGLDDMTGGSWFGLFAPARTADDRIGYLNRAFVRTLNDPEVKKKLADRGIFATSSTPEGLTAFVDSEIGRWSGVVREAKIELE